MRNNNHLSGTNDILPIKGLEKVVASGVAVLLVFLVLFIISAPFEYGSSKARPTLAVVGLLIAAAAAATWGLFQARRIPLSHHRKLLFVVIAFAISARLVALFTCPILEIDYYRYIWDGKVVAEGVSPYDYSPIQVLEANSPIDKDLNRLSQLLTGFESNHTILNRVHFGNYTSVYPPVSQFVFATTMKWFPGESSVESHIIAIKFAMVLFDLGIIAVVCGLLGLLNVHPSWLIVYAWNPLVIKEIANSGHLDSIATFLMVLSLFAIVYWLCSAAKHSIDESAHSIGWLLGGGVSLGLGVGAKLFPIVLFPALLVALGKRSWSAAGVFFLAFSLTTTLVLWPLYSTQVKKSESLVAKNVGSNEAVDVQAANSNQSASSKKTNPPVVQSTPQEDGFSGFFSSWRINDPIFSTIYLNLGSRRSDSNRHWFVLTNRQWRTDFSDWCDERNFGGKNPAFFVTRILTLGLFSIFYLWLLFVIYRTPEIDWDGSRFVARLGMIVAVFLVLQPTVNPWYFVWVAPLACFSKNRGWLLGSSLLLIYYTRFWLDAMVDNLDFAGRSFSGIGIFDHLVVFAEFGAVVAVLLYFCRHERQNGGSRSKRVARG